MKTDLINYCGFFLILLKIRIKLGDLNELTKVNIADQNFKLH